MDMPRAASPRMVPNSRALPAAWDSAGEGGGGGSGPWSGVAMGCSGPARAGAGGLRCDVDADGVEGGAGDLLGAVQDGLDRGAADEAEQAADHAAGAAVQVLLEPGQGAGLV